MTAAHPTLREKMLADQGAPRTVRRRMSTWLGALPLSGDQAEDIILAVDEAVTNVVEHAYPSTHAGGEVVVEAELSSGADGRDRVTVTVADDGSWRPIPEDPGHRGRGLAMMRACTARMRVDATGAGTRVTLVSEPI